MMYLKTREDQQQALSQAWQVLVPGSHLYLWDIDLYQRPDTKKNFYLIRLRYQVGKNRKETAYGARFPVDRRGEDYYLQLAGEVDFQHRSTERISNLLYLEFVKPK